MLDVTGFEWRPNATKRINKTYLTTDYLLAVHAVAGCADGATSLLPCSGKHIRAQWHTQSLIQSYSALVSEVD